MDLYLFSLLLGFAGLAFMALAGLVHQGDGHGHGAGHAHGGHHGHDAGGVSLHHHAGHASGPLPAHHGGDASGDGPGHGHVWDVQQRAGSVLLALLSPRVLSSLLLGFGAVGLVVAPWLGGPLQGIAALAGALLLEVGVIRPVWTLLAGFASPARTLESAVMEPARAASSFDANGQGLVALEVDGQITQILGTLRPADRELGVRVRAGDRLLVEEVDPARNRCTVSYLGS